MSAPESKKVVYSLHSKAWDAFCDKHVIKSGTYARDKGYYSSYGGRNYDHHISEEQFHLLIRNWDRAYAENSGWRGYLNTIMPVAE